MDMSRMTLGDVSVTYGLDEGFYGVVPGNCPYCGSALVMSGVLTGLRCSDESCVGRVANALACMCEDLGLDTGIEDYLDFVSESGYGSHLEYLCSDDCDGFNFSFVDILRVSYQASFTEPVIDVLSCLGVGGVYEKLSLDYLQVVLGEGVSVDLLRVYESLLRLRGVYERLVALGRL